MIESFVCDGCDLVTWSMFNLAGKPHINCSAGDGCWERESGPTRHAPDRLWRILACVLVVVIVLLAVAFVVIGGR